jgi:hypothetical protein
MPQSKSRQKTDPQSILRSLALSYPDTAEGVACAGTALEKRTIKVRNKAFLFLGAKDAMLKLGDSLPQATQLARQQPQQCKVGAHGWVTVALGDETVPIDVLRRWIEESYRLLAPKQLVAALPAGGLRAGASRKAAKRAAPKKGAKRTRSR